MNFPHLMFLITIEEDIWTNYLARRRNQIYSIHTIHLAFSQMWFFEFRPQFWKRNIIIYMFIDEKAKVPKG